MVHQLELISLIALTVHHGAIGGSEAQTYARHEHRGETIYYSIV